jgi:serine O-acetyltransferase
MKPERLWWLSTRAYQRGHIRIAKALKLFNYLAFRAVLPYECELSKTLKLHHLGLAVVIHPNTRIGEHVQLSHGITVAAGSEIIGSPHRVILEDRSALGAGAMVIPGKDRAITIGARAVVGAGAVVTDDVQPGARVAGIPARPVKSRGAAVDPA